MSPRDHAALELYQTTKHEPRAVAEAILDQFFSFPSLSEYEETQEKVAQEFAR